MPLRERVARGARVLGTAAVALTVAGTALVSPGGRSASVGALELTGNFGTASVQQSPPTKLLASGSGPYTISIMASDVTTPAISLAGDGLDNDGDSLVDEDPVTGVDEDGDGQKDEDPAEAIDSDGDGQADEDPPAGQMGSDDDNDGREGGSSAAAGTCDDQLDNDGTGGRDLADPDCAGTGESAVIDEDPARGVNKDGDGLVDEDSPDDDGDGRVNEDPPGGGDNDGDGSTDEDGKASDCGSPISACAYNQDGDSQADEDGPNDDMDGTGRESGTGADNCSDNIDNDGDGAIDGYDPQCLQRVNEDDRNEDGDGNESTGTGFPWNCADGIDNDSDGQFDGTDVQCAAYRDEDGGTDTDLDGRFDEDSRDDDRDGTQDEDGPLPCLVNDANPAAGTLGCGLGAYRIRITYNPAIVQYQPSSASNGSFLTSNGRWLQACTTTTGSGWVEYACSTSAALGNPATKVGPQGSGVLATVSFSAVALGSSALSLAGSELLDVQGRPLSLTLTSGQASVVPCPDVPTGVPPAHDGTVGITTDVVEELEHVGAKSTDPGWLTHEPYDVDNDGGIGITTDVVRMLAFVGLSCTQ